MKAVILCVLLFRNNLTFCQSSETGSIDISLQYDGNYVSGYYIFLIDKKNRKIIEDSTIDKPTYFRINNLAEGYYEILVLKEGCFSRSEVQIQNGKITFADLIFYSEKFLSKRKNKRLKANCHCQHNDVVFKYDVLEAE